MSSEFLDTNILVYAYDASAGQKHRRATELIRELLERDEAALSIQVLSEFFNVATRKLKMSGTEAETAVTEFGVATIHAPVHADLVSAVQLFRRYKLDWWDALIVASAQALGCSILWSEDLQHNQHFGSLTIKNPFR
ncbi:MAG: PIN domain-containing protein [Acidobacteriota bacterium]